MRISGLSLVPVSVASVAVLFALSACGGGGGGSGGSSPALRSAALALSIVPLPPLSELYEIAQSNSASCPSIGVEGGALVMDFGSSGCSNSQIGQSRGRVRVQIVTQNVAQVSFENFSWGGLPLSLNGSSVVDINQSTASGELRYAIPGACEVVFNVDSASGVGTATPSLQGTYTSPASGSVSFTANISFSDCDWPTGGTITLSANNQTATVQFGPSCGVARYTIGGQTVTRNLDELFENILQIANPCGQ